jgi:putative oxidoreductase
MDELAHLVAERSPPSKVTSTASAFAMFSTLSVSDLISSREYIIDGVKFTKVAPYLQSVLRIVAAVVFIAHGSQKLFAYPGGSRVAIASLLGLAGILEVGGGTLMLIGLFARPTALVLAGEMAYAYYTVHLPRGRWPILNGGELAVLFCVLWLYFSAAGPGPISIDRILRRA